MEEKRARGVDETKHWVLESSTGVEKDMGVGDFRVGAINNRTEQATQTYIAQVK